MVPSPYRATELVGLFTRDYCVSEKPMPRSQVPTSPPRSLRPLLRAQLADPTLGDKFTAPLQNYERNTVIQARSTFSRQRRAVTGGNVSSSGATSRRSREFADVSRVSARSTVADRLIKPSSRPPPRKPGRRAERKVQGQIVTR